MRNMNLPGKEYFPTSRIVVSVRWISLFQMDIPGSNRLPKGCSLAHHGSFVTFILSGQFLRKVSRKYHKSIAERLKECLSDHALLLAYAKELENFGLSRAADTIYRFEHGLMNYRAFPPEHWKKIRTTNLLERVNKELKRRSRKIGAFPNDASFNSHGLLTT